MKKLIAMLLTLTALCSLFAGCASNKDTDDTDYASMSIEELKPLIKTVTDGKLTVATSPDYAPYEFYTIGDDGKATLAGFDIDFAHYIADFLGLDLEIVTMDFNGTLAELKNKKCDLAMAGYSPDPKREGSMDFSDIYYTGGQSFVCLEENADLFTALEDANNSELQIGAQIGSIQHTLAMENMPDADIITLAKATNIIAELVSGKLDGAIVETVVAEAYKKTFPELHIAFDVPYEATGNVIGVSKGNGALLAGVNLAIKAVTADGTLNQFVADANELAAGNIHEGLLNEDGTLATGE